MRFQGAFTALVTPMLPDQSVDYKGLEQNIEFQISQGITGLVPVGTTGESPTLTWEDHSEVAARTFKWVDGRCDVIVGTGSNSTAESIESARHAVNAGVESILLVDCYYNGPSSQELRDEYYAPIAQLFPKTDIVPYVIPGRSGTALSVEDLAILSDQFPNVRTVKEATGDIDRMIKTRELCGPDFSILSGDDDITFKMMTDPAIAASGVISVATNVVPGAITQMVKSANDGDVAGAEKLLKALSPFFGIITVKVDNERILPDGRKVMVNDRYRNPLAIKTLMAGLGMPAGFARPPLGKMSKSGVNIVRRAVRDVWRSNPEVLQPVADFYGVNIEARVEDDSVWLPLTRL